MIKIGLDCFKVKILIFVYVLISILKSILNRMNKIIRIMFIMPKEKITLFCSSDGLIISSKMSVDLFLFSPQSL